MNERTLPHNLDAERSVLGAILLRNDAINAAVEVLQPRTSIGTRTSCCSST